MEDDSVENDEAAVESTGACFNSGGGADEDVLEVTEEGEHSVLVRFTSFLLSPGW
jgi:hypothetical protein